MSIDNLTVTAGNRVDDFSMVRGSLVKTPDTIDETPIDIDVISVTFFDPDGGTANIFRESDGAKTAFTYEGIDAALNQLSSCTLASGSFDFVANDKIEL